MMTIDSLRTAMAATLAEMGGDPRIINDGGCCDFAAAVVRRFECARAEWGCDVAPELEWCGCHCYIVFDGRYYDAECFDGVARPHGLPFYRRI